MKWPFAHQETPATDVAPRARRETAPSKRLSEVDWLRSQLEQANARYHALALLLGQPSPVVSAPAFEIPKGPLDVLGPLARMALTEMQHGLGGASKRAMEAKVLLLAQTVSDDAALAQLIRRGETVPHLSMA